MKMRTKQRCTVIQGLSPQHRFEVGDIVEVGELLPVGLPRPSKKGAAITEPSFRVSCGEVDYIFTEREMIRYFEPVEDSEIVACRPPTTP